MSGQHQFPVVYPQASNPVPIIHEPMWALGLVRTCTRNVAPRGFDPRSIQPIASRYTNCAQRRMSAFNVYTEKTQHYHVCRGFEYLKQNISVWCSLSIIMVQNNMEKFKWIPICTFRAQTLGHISNIRFIYSNAVFVFKLLLLLCCPNHINIKTKLMIFIARVISPKYNFYRNLVK
jgi:hypothetical protein